MAARWLACWPAATGWRPTWSGSRHSDARRITRVIARKGGRTGSGLSKASGMTGLTCTIVVSGELGDRFVGAFGGLALAREGGTTRLAGVLIDQAELNGVLNQLVDCGSGDHRDRHRPPG